MNKRRFIITLLWVFAAAYLLGPIIAGARRAGNRLGPMIYPEGFHGVLYTLAHEGAHNEKPRVPLDYWMYDRPWFYGTPRRLKPERERQEYLEMLRRNQSPILEMAEKMNRELQWRGTPTGQ